MRGQGPVISGTGYEEGFAWLTDFAPWEFQRRAGRAMWSGRNVLLSAPTGCGKTLAAVAPFVLGRERMGVSRLIYALPLRTLVTSIAETLRRLAAKHGGGLRVAVQTGESPEAPYFDSDITITTYDQLLSGFLASPYSLSGRQYNMNCAASAGAVVVFDEYHLMEADKAFATGVEMLRVFGEVSRSVWMTATGTPPLREHLKRKLQAEEVVLDAAEQAAAYEGRGIRRVVRLREETMRAEHLIELRGKRRLAVVNQVQRAQDLLAELRRSPPEDVRPENIVLLHARFFPSDRREKQARLERLFGAGATEPAIAIATQVVEAGIDISAEHVLTEVSPMNSVVQRAGRCARFSGERGEVDVFRVANPLPYSAAELDAAWRTIEDGADLKPERVAAWVDAVHREEDRRSLEGAKGRADECRRRIVDRVVGTAQGGVSQWIREASDTVRVMVMDDPGGVIPKDRESIALYRAQVDRLVKAGVPVQVYNPDADGLWEAAQAGLGGAFVVAIPRTAAAYDREVGLRLGMAGTEESPEQRGEKPEWAPLVAETWQDHTRAVAANAARLLEGPLGASELMRRLWPALPGLLKTACLGHDVGKLQDRWQMWARDYQMRHGAGEPVEALAHTDFDWKNPAHREAQKLARPSRPPHALASAWYLGGDVDGLGEEERVALQIAVLTHHGGWDSQGEVFRLCGTAAEQMAAVELRAAAKGPFDRMFTRRLQDVMEDEFEVVWPLAAVLVRLLRLADQKATREVGALE